MRKKFALGALVFVLVLEGASVVVPDPYICQSLDPCGYLAWLLGCTGDCPGDAGGGGGGGVGH